MSGFIILMFYSSHLYIKIVNTSSLVNLIMKFSSLVKRGWGRFVSHITLTVDKSSLPLATRRDQSNKYISLEYESAVDF